MPWSMAFCSSKLQHKSATLSGSFAQFAITVRLLRSNSNAADSDNSGTIHSPQVILKP
tara:strand:+ start:1911 stop:2084 length:174 start_codon:yes stop_codon:yes gene_type:complete